MSREKKKKSGSKPVPLLVPEDMHKQVRKVAEKSGLSDAAIMRLAIERGITAVEKMFEPEKQAT